ncbi:uncharacterized protein [Nothobranchius furzeri]|uniref:uncharacterized protein isoform X2 n=1 Tax=Nothobranchius furzeri TaxID=105023 RepID=UPI003904D00C
MNEQHQTAASISPPTPPPPPPPSPAQEQSDSDSETAERAPEQPAAKLFHKTAPQSILNFEVKKYDVFYPFRTTHDRRRERTTSCTCTEKTVKEEEAGEIYTNSEIKQDEAWLHASASEFRPGGSDPTSAGSVKGRRRFFFFIFSRFLLSFVS